MRCVSKQGEEGRKEEKREREGQRGKKGRERKREKKQPWVGGERQRETERQRERECKVSTQGLSIVSLRK